MVGIVKTKSEIDSRIGTYTRDMRNLVLLGKSIADAIDGMSDQEITELYPEAADLATIRGLATEIKALKTTFNSNKACHSKCWGSEI